MMEEYVAAGLRKQANARNIDRALTIVKKFIADRNLVLYGGQAIDYALRLIGKSLYSDVDRPDFDFYSPDNVKDAYELSRELHMVGLPNVSVITALHVQTMRVRVDFETVADISFMPSSVFQKLQTLTYQEMKIIHPHWIRMDQHLAFCFPFNNFPREDVFHRYKKDLDRFNMLAEVYPFEDDAQLDVGTKSRQKVSAGVHCGFSAHALLKKALDMLKTGKPADFHVIDLGEDQPACRILFEKPPEDAKNPLMDWVPASTDKDGEHLLYIPHRKIAAVRLDGDIYITSVQYVLLYFLVHWHTTKREIYKAHYIDTLQMLNEGGKLILNTTPDVVATSPFSFPINTVGAMEASDSFLLTMGRLAKDTGVDLSAFPWAQYIPDVSNLPQNYYPHRAGVISPKFNYMENKLFHMDGN